MPFTYSIQIYFYFSKYVQCAGKKIGLLIKWDLVFSNVLLNFMDASLQLNVQSLICISLDLSIKLYGIK
jgi:hypothetical protein